VLIVNRGRLVIESPLAELRGRVGGTVRVRSPQAPQLREALAAAGIEADGAADGVLHVRGSAAERVGEVAAAAGVVLHELVEESSSLEDVFFELTSEAGG
jgi:ABC-2 type transport system ATP-binding protein